MMNMEVDIIRPDNYGWIATKLSSESMDFLWKCIDNKKGDYRSHLAGNISESYQIEDENGWFSGNVIRQLLKKYEESFGNMAKSIPTTKSHPFSLHGFWVNYQKKHEFNPIHAHGGTLSSVIMIDVPEEIAKEVNSLDYETNMPCPGQLEFIDGPTSYLCPGTYKVVPKTGDIFIFPAELKHTVYPFTSDVERVTMSFNVFDIEKIYD